MQLKSLEDNCLSNESVLFSTIVLDALLIVPHELYTSHSSLHSIFKDLEANEHV